MTKSVRRPAKLPVQQLVILAICRFAEPVAMTSIFPYLPEMMEYLGVETNRVAFWAGVTSAIFSLCQALTAVAWGRVADIHGRKPVILVGLGSTMASSILFGFSRSLLSAMVARAIAGGGDGNIGTMRTMVAEMVPQKELQPRAFSIMPLMWTIGSILGPAFGGMFANPAKRYPDTFGDSRFFRDFPYALPNLLASALFLIGISSGFLFLRETLVTRKHNPDYGIMMGKRLTRVCTGRREKATSNGDHEASALLGDSRRSSLSTKSNADSHHLAKDTKPDHTYRDVFSPQSSVNLLAYSVLCLHSVAYDQLLPVFMHHPRQEHTNNPDVQLPFKFAGGFALDSGRIGLLITLYGICGIFVQFFIFPPLARHAGILNCLKGCVITLPILYVLTPFVVLVSSGVMQQVVMMAIMICKSIVVVFAFPCAIIMLTNSAVSMRILATLNGVATSLSALGRAAGLAIDGSTFTLGIDIGYGVLPWWTLALLAVVGAAPVWFLEEKEGFGGEDSDSEDSAGEENGEAAAGNEEEAVISADEDVAVAAADGPPITRVSSRRSRRSSSNHRRISSPIGVRGGVVSAGVRRLSSNLGHSNNGYGAGGTSWH